METAIYMIFQEINQSMPHWFQQGGIVMWLLLLASFLTTTVTLERLFAWTFYSQKKERFAIHNCFASLNRLNPKEAQKFSRALNSPASNMLKEGLRALPFPASEKMENQAEKELSQMSRGQSLLDTVITLAPMLGILGTVLGIIDSFNILSLQGIDNPTAVVGGIAQALISTAMGLCVALLALLPYNLFRSFLQKLTLHLETVATEFNHICQQKRLISKKVSSIVQDQEKSLLDPMIHNRDSEVAYYQKFTASGDEKKTSASALKEMFEEETIAEETVVEKNETVYEA